MKKSLWETTPEMPDDREYEVHHRVTDNPEPMSVFHNHECFECYLFISGSIDYAIEEKLYSPKPYDMFMIPPGIMHRWVARPPVGRYERMYFYITPECLKEMSTPGFNMLEILSNAASRHNYSFHLDMHAGAELASLAKEAVRSSVLTDPADLLMTRCRVNILAATYCRLIDQGAEASSSAPSRMREIITYINDHITEPISLDDLAEHFFISKSYLLHTFKEYANISVYQYILGKRVMLSQRLMREGMAPGAASRASGFSDYAGFYRAFVKQTGVTPQDFCKSDMPHRPLFIDTP
ncbi:MAG: helix-turn-helix domain-containing protein [Aristaeellaceae bacterium]